MKLIIEAFDTAWSPSRGTVGSAGWDIYAPRSLHIPAGGTTIMGCGFKTEIEPGWFAKVFDRSGAAAKRRLTVRAGVIDSDYRLEWGVVLVNESSETIYINQGDRVAQFVLLPVPDVDLVLGSVNLNTERQGGFGSTGQ